MFNMVTKIKKNSKALPSPTIEGIVSITGNKYFKFHVPPTASL